MSCDWQTKQTNYFDNQYETQNYNNLVFQSINRLEQKSYYMFEMIRGKSQMVLSKF